MDREQRVSLHAKQNRLRVETRAPFVQELDEGVPAFAFVKGVLTEYVKYNNVLYKKVWDKA